MQVELCLVLDEKGYHRLVLKTAESFEMDEYTSKNFDNSDQIRIKYRKQIESYLESYKERISKTSEPSYAGRIAIVIPSKIGGYYTDYQRKILYKKHIIAFKELLGDKSIVIKFSNFEKTKKQNDLLPDYFHRIVRLPWTRRYRVKTYINNWEKVERTKRKNYYEIIRDILFVYSEERKKVSTLPTIDKIYSDYAKRQAAKKLARREKIKIQQSVKHEVVANSVKIEEIETQVFEDVKDERIYHINGNMYTVDELHLFDIEDLKNIESDYIPDIIKENDKAKKI